MPTARVDRTAFNQVYRPPGHLLIADAIDGYGRLRFDDDWTGLELDARIVREYPSHPRMIALLESMQKPTFGRVPLKSDKVSNPKKLPWRALTRSGWQIMLSRGAAYRLAKKELPEILARWRAEYAARQRLDCVVDELRGHLASGRLPTYGCDSATGQLVPLPPEIWNSEQAVNAFYLEDIRERWDDPCFLRVPSSTGDGPNGRRLRVVVKEEELRRVCPRRYTQGAETECRAWLLELMHRGAQQGSKDEYRMEAERRFKIGTRAFDRAWAAAKSEAGATGWGNAGRIPKSRRRIVTPR